MRNQVSQIIFDYWTDLKGDRGAPLRTEIDPTALRHLLPHLFIATVGLEGHPVFRLAGTRICDLFGRELRGAGFAEIWLEDDSKRSVEIIHNVLHYEQPALLDVLASDDDVRHDYEMLLLPVRSVAEARCDRILGALLPHGSPFPATRLPLAGLSLENWAFLDGHDANFGAFSLGDRRGIAETLRRLLSFRFSLSNGAS